MKTLYFGATGPQVQLLQLALARTGASFVATDGRFGPQTLSALKSFQRRNGLAADGIAGPATHAALRPWYTGYLSHTLRSGDSFYRLAQRYGSTVAAISAANPDADPLRLLPGQTLTIPFSFDVVPTQIVWCSELLRFCCEGLAARYPALSAEEIGRSAMGRPLHLLRIGSGKTRVLYTATHHANEWITTPLLMKFVEQLARADAFSEELFGRSARALLEGATCAVVPCVNPDGMDLVTGDLQSGSDYAAARSIAADYPGIAFPSGWKANIRGVDLNLQYPAGWENAREIKFSQGFVSPAPRDYVGLSALSAPESKAMYAYTLAYSPALTLSYHTQGSVIYWKYLNYDPPGALALGRRFAAVSSYLLETTPYASGFAGYKDWFIQEFSRPGYTVEAGLGDNPLPLTQFDRIYGENLGILTLGLALAPQLPA